MKVTLIFNNGVAKCYDNVNYFLTDDVNAKPFMCTKKEVKQ